MSLRGPFHDYFAVVQQIFHDARTEAGRLSSLPLLLSDEQLLLRVVEQVEAKKEFDALAVATVRDCHGDKSETHVNGTWLNEIRTYFRLSGLYQAIFRDESIDVQQAAERYRQAFRNETNTVSLIAPLEFVDFTGGPVGWGEYRIRQFSRAELDSALRNQAKKIFCKWAHIDTETLTDYWLLLAQHTIPAKKPGTVRIHIESRVEPTYTGYPVQIEAALKDLALFDWGTVRPFDASPPGKSLRPRYTKWDAPFHPHIPFVISVSDSLIEWPSRAPDFSILETLPYFNPVTGEESGERPTPGMHLSQEETEAITRFLQSVAELSKNRLLYQSEWDFIDMSLRFLVKAFTSEGLEQLLWHMTAIEAALGEKVEAGLTKLLKTRVSNILGTGEAERKDYGKLFDELYSYRSDLVHGNAGLADKKIYRGHLSEARDFARCVVVWMVHFLAHVASAFPGGSAEMPSRANLLALLDLNSDEWRELSPLIRGLPKDFPNVAGWS